MKLYIVPTPIGNLEDITLRALRVLGEVDVVVCEDTRVTGKLLKHFDIKRTLVSYHANATDKQEDKVLQLLSEGKTLALVTDAGTPCISDPGSRLIARIYAELPEVHVEALPGPSAVVTALSASGISTAEFQFLGFVPHKKGRQTFFVRLSESETVCIFYESPHRIMKTLESLKGVLDPGRKVVVARELTKIYEQYVRGNAEEVLDYFTQNPDKVKGEFVVIVDK